MIGFRLPRISASTGEIVLGVIVVLVILAQVVSSIPDFSTPLERFELAAFDLAMRLRGSSTPETPIVLVAIDDASFNYTGYQWPWPRAYLAQMIDVLNKSGARVVGLDVFLFEKDPDPLGDEALVKALGESRAAGAIMHISRTEQTETLNLPLKPYMDALDGVGITGIIYDDDAIVRSIQAFDYSEYANKLYLNWAFEIARLYLETQKPTQVTSSRLIFNNLEVPLYSRNMNINFSGPPETFPTFSAHQVALGDYPVEAFQDKIVLIGATTVTMQDIYPTPFSATRRTPGVEVVANAINTIITGQFIKSAPPLINIGFTLLAVLAAWLVRRNRAPIATLIIIGVLMLGYAVLWYLLLTRARYQFWLGTTEAILFLGVVIPIMEQVVGQEIEKRRMRSLFSRFISPEMVGQLLDTKDISSLNKRATLTMLFADIRNFTSLSEKLSPEDVVRLLNPFLEAMTDVIHKYGGTVDKYEGDAIVAFFGEPIQHKDHARRAILAAYEMRRVLTNLRWQWREEGQYSGEFEIGIGINTGEVFVGLLGSEQRVNYTVIGDAVNLAARLQDQTKELGWPILISGETYSQVKDEFLIEFAEAKILKGKSGTVDIYKLIGPKT